jgi:hypothetical protein
MPAGTALRHVARTVGIVHRQGQLPPRFQASSFRRSGKIDPGQGEPGSQLVCRS